MMSGSETLPIKVVETQIFLRPGEDEMDVQCEVERQQVQD